MENEQLRKIAVNSGSIVIVLGILLFFFANDETASMPLSSRVIAALIGIITALIALRIAFAKKIK